MSSVSVGRAHVLARIAVSLGGTWLFIWGFTALSIASLFAIGMPYFEAYSLVMLIAIPLFLAAFCAAYVVRSLFVAGVVLIGGGAAMSVLAHLLTRHLAA